jgi:hypothetical protein
LQFAEARQFVRDSVLAEIDARVYRLDGAETYQREVEVGHAEEKGKSRSVDPIGIFSMEGNFEVCLWDYSAAAAITLASS